MFQNDREFLSASADYYAKLLTLVDLTIQGHEEDERQKILRHLRIGMSCSQLTILNLIEYGLDDQEMRVAVKILNAIQDDKRETR